MNNTYPETLFQHVETLQQRKFKDEIMCPTDSSPK